MKNKLEIGCGDIDNKQDDTLYLDIKKFKNIDIVRDIEKGLPFNNETFEYIKAHHVLEHIKDLIFVMNEIHRVLKPKGILDLEVPIGHNAWIDPTHVRAFDENGFDFFRYEDFNSTNAGVTGFFDLIKGQKLGPVEGDWRGLNMQLQKR